jgi:predicted P-loop ATPase
MSSFNHPSSSDRRASSFARAANRQTKRKTESKIDASTEIIPDFWFPGDEQTPKNQELLDSLTRQPIEPGMGKHFAGCGALNGNIYDAEILEVAPVRMPGGALSFLEVRWRAPGDEKGSKRFTHPFRAYDCHKNHMNDVTGERQPFLCDRWKHFWEGDKQCDKPGLLLPLNADKLKTACDAATKARKAQIVAWVLCEGAHSLRGVERRLNDPAVAHIVEKWKRDNGIDHIVVGAWIGGMPGAQHTNFGMLAHPDKQIVGQNDWELNFSELGPIGRVVIVPDHDNDGHNEKEIVAKRLKQEFGCSQEKIYETRFPEGAREHWDDDNELPTDVTQEMRVDQLLNSKQWEPDKFIKDEKGKFVLVPNNIDIRMGQLFDVLEPLYFDEFRGCVMLREPLTPEYVRGEYPRRVTDNDMADIANLIRRTLGGQFVKTSEAQVREALVTYTRKHSHHPLREYLQGIEWDGTPRIDTALHDYLGVVDNEHSRLASANFFKSGVARAIWPGEKVQETIVLHGEEATFKSTFGEILAGKGYYSDCLPPLGNGEKAIRNAQLHIQDHWIVEVPENAALRNADAERIKHFLTIDDDIYLAPYGHHDESHPRHVIFIITTNLNRLFKDATGNRRFVSVHVGEAFTPTPEHMRRLEEDRDQLWAEAYHRVVELEETWHVDAATAKRLFKPVQEAHRDIPMEEEIFLAEMNRVAKRKVVMIWPRQLNQFVIDLRKNTGRMLPYVEMMERLGWTRKNRRIRIENKHKKQARINGKLVTPVTISSEPRYCWALDGPDTGGHAYNRQFVYHSGNDGRVGAWRVEPTWIDPLDQQPPNFAGGKPE